MSTLRRTILAQEHENAGARMVDFAGWWMPVQYQGLREEHETVRTKVGLFDVSHMGEVWVRGPKSLSTLEWLTTNDVAKLKAGEAQYSLLPNAEGGLVDDIIVYCVTPGQEYLVCVNAANTDKDFAWMNANNRGADITNESHLWSQIAVQGPQARTLLERVFPGHGIVQTPPFHFLKLAFAGQTCWLATTGYTGEAGGEIFVPNSTAVELWRTLLSKGQDLGVAPIGLGARDTLRTEMKYSLYGHEIDDKSNPYAAGLGWVVKPSQKDFIGKTAMVAGKEQGLKKALVGFKMLDKGIPRQGYSLWSKEGQEIGQVTSGTVSPTLDEPIGIAYIATAYQPVDSEFWVDIRGRKAKAKVCKTPFVATKP